VAVVAVVLVDAGIGLLAVVIVSAIYSASSRQTMHRRRIAQRILLLWLPADLVFGQAGR
jgi:hypothetical protein